ncbi:leucyl aminopeptidase [Microbacterium marinilacus]|uniref:Probable cytosol aminopeptidase n=1 Tax=Microbacterium marinilacus TaxID=415209 RepID=A0ABP7BPR4_9MICO|nr:leucyl aminopeptidase [Microbacterium marinilacus]MBY0690415.1 leucyl aminopeptidase [Microbacterium marinilacus]
MNTALPELRLDAADPAAIDADVLVVAVANRSGEIDVEPTAADGPSPGAAALGEDAARALRDAARAVGHRAKEGSALRVPAPTGVAATSVLLVGLGEAGTSSAATLRRVAGTALRALDGVETVALALPLREAGDVAAVVTGALLGAYRYTAYRADGAGRGRVASVVIAAPAASQPEADEAATVARAVAAARDLVNRPPLDLFPQSFAEAVVAQAESLGDRVQVEVVDDDELRRRGFGGLIGVGSGSTRAPRLVKVSYSPAGAERHLSIVGKGITFDSGGISIKPAAKMEKMTSDMAGAAAAVQAVFAIAELGLPVRATAWLALAENLPSGSAMRPADVLRIYGGKTVEVINTDAEGRLVLADALVAAQEESPDLLVDVATLTGAQVAALGYRTSGVMGTPGAQQRVLQAAEAVGEPMWGMPIPGEMIGYFDSHIADLKNAGAPAGGMLAASAFLRAFVADGVEWAHLDIAGPAYASDPHGYTTVGGTGVPVRTLVETARALAG